MELFLNAGDERGLSTQLYDQIREAIADGRLPPGGRLQPSRAVAHGLGIARSTVTDAYARLTAEGYVEGRRGGGSIVVGHASPPPELSEAPTAPAPTAQAATATPHHQPVALPALAPAPVSPPRHRCGLAYGTVALCWRHS